LSRSIKCNSCNELKDLKDKYKVISLTFSNLDDTILDIEFNEFINLKELYIVKIMI
jgi:hypothetical protein